MAEPPRPPPICPLPRRETNAIASSEGVSLRLVAKLHEFLGIGSQLREQSRVGAQGETRDRLSAQYRRKVTSIGTIVATGLPPGPTAGLNFQPLTASMAFSSKPSPGPFTTEMLMARPSVVMVT
jgi:hypothetical protein